MICISMGFEPNTGTISAKMHAKAVILLNCFELVSNWPDWKSAIKIGTIRSMGNIEDNPALSVPKKNNVKAKRPATGSKVLTMSKTFVTGSFL